MEFVFHGARISSTVPVITAAKASRMIQKGCCEAFLISLVGDKTNEVTTVDDVPIVREFKDVFPEDLPGLPPDRQVELTIDLLPAAAPVSKAPYRMAPKKLQELKIQLQELLDK